MKKRFALLLVTCVLAACAPVKDAELNEDDVGKMVDVTQQTTCQGATPLGTTIYRAWNSDFQSTVKNESIHKTLTVEHDAVSLKTICKYGSVETSVTARANASVTATMVQTLSNDSQSVTTSIDGKSRTCVSEIATGVMNYTFQGACLKTMSNGQTQLMTQ